MTRRTTRIAALGAGSLLAAFGFLGATPAGASDGAQADATVSADTTDAINQTLGLINQACVDAGRLGEAATSGAASAGSDATASILGEHGISLAAGGAGNALNLNVSLPALTKSLPDLGSLPILGSVAGHVDAAQPLQVSCAASADGTGFGLSAAGVDALVGATGIDVSGLDINIPTVAAGGSATTSGSAAPGTTAVRATAAGSLPAAKAGAAPSAQTSAAAPAATATTSAAADATPPSTGTSVAAGTLARTGAGVGALGLLGSFLIGGGRLLAFGRRFLRIG
jgi:hypothetical protein